ncbi:2-oxoacid:acceptor oxidoreductase family protein [Thioalkalicoccus limnaeus]|uniref:2-oxoacid:acceptor oxidoreductase family protein n=1 Tax=Thioalkalicoccus limnaeus TaxID=120681 RepID=A0ABV4BFF8_9GAMM
MNKVTNVVIAGLGGQGVVTFSDMLAMAAFNAGHDVKQSELHGMSQRGGSVSSDVRFGPTVLSPMVPAGEADYLVVLESTQVEVNRGLLKPDGCLLTPELIPEGALRNKKSLNVAMLGALSAVLEIPEPVWLDAVHAKLAAKLHKVNDQAFALGREAGAALSRPTPSAED